MTEKWKVDCENRHRAADRTHDAGRAMEQLVEAFEACDFEDPFDYELLMSSVAHCKIEELAKALVKQVKRIKNASKEA